MTVGSIFRGGLSTREPSCSLPHRAHPARGVLERQKDEPISRKRLALLLESHPLFLDLLSVVPAIARKIRCQKELITRLCKI